MSTNWIQNFYKTDIQGLERLLKISQEDYWLKKGETQALKIFHNAAANVPAYKDFLKKNQVDHNKIKSITDLKHVPTTDKKNYIHYYPLKSRSWNGELTASKITASSSGTTGQPHYWHRSGTQEYQAAIKHELIYRNLFDIHKNSTLLIIGFPMGVYVSGMATILPSWLIAQKYNINIVSAGNNKTEVLKAVKNLSAHFDQTLLVGHPFFIKDVIEAGKIEGINWRSIKIKILMCSEGFSESWREYLIEESGIKNRYAGCFSAYGSSEMLLMAHETPLSISIKKLMEKKPALALKHFSRQHAPSIFQYNPEYNYIEDEKRELIFTSDSGIPLIRFNLKDSGIIWKYSEAIKLMPEDTRNANTHGPAWKLPFVMLWGRSDQTLIFYAANIYPDHIHLALNKNKFFKDLTGKFTMQKGYFKNMDEYLEINLELKNNSKESKGLSGKIKQGIMESLRHINSEFADAEKKFGEKTIPRIKLWPYGHAKYFKAGLKPKYIQ